MRSCWRAAAALLLGLTAITGLVYPLAVTGLAQTLFPDQANGSLLVAHGRAVGSRLVGQAFSSPHYFWGRLSATSPVPYNASASSGSNLAVSNPALLAAIEARVADLRRVDPANQAPIPVDLVTASGSGLDSHISLAAAAYQTARVARARHLDEAVVRALVARHTKGRQLGLLGEPRVEVLALNLSLDDLGQ